MPSWSTSAGGELFVDDVKTTFTYMSLPMTSFSTCWSNSILGGSSSLVLSTSPLIPNVSVFPFNNRVFTEFTYVGDEW